MIRKAYKSDVPAMILLAEQLFKESSYGHVEPSKARIRTTFETMIDAGFAMVAVIDGAIIGGMIGDVYTPWYSLDKLGVDYSIFVLPKHRNGLIAYKLIKAFEKWCIESGAKQIRPGVGTGNKNLTRLYNKMGFETVGTWHLKNI